MKRIVAISRELGSGGRTIGKLVAKQKNIPYYDRELIDEAAKASGIPSEYIEKSDQKVTNSLLYNLAMGSCYSYGLLEEASNQPLPLTTTVFCAQQEIIRGYADAGSCVIVGRCADYVLRDRDDVLSVFIYADMDKRVEHGVKEYGMHEETARKEIARSDRERAHHYSMFTDRTWGDRRNYDIMLNSGEVSYENCAKIICEMMDMKA
ncbi:MAG: cytidylate kinase-like family protein [Oscillospiraceae bacterium]|nr:cytidylate kinase-like family protein [Ruminococcus sp.]MCD8344451.1 cytidylate kinase-like family protein [Oscillospiraceae bacterium]